MLGHTCIGILQGPFDDVPQTNECNLSFIFFCRIIKISMQKRLLPREKESDKGCFLFQDLLPPVKYKMRCWTRRRLYLASQANFMN